MWLPLRAVSKRLAKTQVGSLWILTSTDMVDTAYSYLYKQANDIIRRDLENFTNIIADKAKGAQVHHQGWVASRGAR